MQIKSLKIFRDVVDCRSFSQAADDNGISQSSVSQVVHQIEESLGVQLLDRSTRPFGLTPEGECYYDGCQQLVKLYESLEEEVTTLHDAQARRLVVAAIYSVGLHHLNELWPRFVASHPRARTKLEHLRPQEVYEAVESGRAELGLMSFPKATDALTVIPWYDEPMVAVFHPQSPLASLETVDAAALAEQPFIGFIRTLALRKATDRYLKDHQVRPQVAHEFDNVENIKKDIEHNAGVSILPERTIRAEIARGTLAMAELACADGSGEPLRRPLGILHRRDRQLSPLAEQLIASLRETARLETPAVADAASEERY